MSGGGPDEEHAMGRCYPCVRCGTDGESAKARDTVRERVKSRTSDITDMLRLCGDVFERRTGTVSAILIRDPLLSEPVLASNASFEASALRAAREYAQLLHGIAADLHAKANKIVAACDKVTRDRQVP